MPSFSYHKQFFLTQSTAANVSNAPRKIFSASPPVRPLVVFIVCFLYGQPAPLVHHNAALISSSIREHRLRLSLLTYSSDPTLLFEQWRTDVQSIDGLSCCIMSADERKGAWSTPCIRGFAIKLTYGSVVHKFSLNLFLVGWLMGTWGFFYCSAVA